MTGSWDAASFRDWLNAQLARREWSMADLARRLDTPNATVARWVNGVRRPSSTSCDRLADVLHVDVDTVLMLAGHRPDVEQTTLTHAQADMISMIRRVDLRPDREELMRLMLEQWLKADRQS